MPRGETMYGTPLRRHQRAADHPNRFQQPCRCTTSTSDARRSSTSATDAALKCCFGNVRGTYVTGTRANSRRVDTDGGNSPSPFAVVVTTSTSAPAR